MEQLKFSESPKFYDSVTTETIDYEKALGERLDKEANIYEKKALMFEKEAIKLEKEAIKFDSETPKINAEANKIEKQNTNKLFDIALGFIGIIFVIVTCYFGGDSNNYQTHNMNNRNNKTYNDEDSEEEQN